MKTVSLLTAMISTCCVLVGCGSPRNPSKAVLHPYSETDAPDAFKVSPSDLDHPPRELKQNIPSYPIDMLQAGASGEVVPSFLVTKEGKVQDIHVLSAPDISFANATRAALAKELYTPATSHGQPVDCRVRRTLKFSLQ